MNSKCKERFKGILIVSDIDGTFLGKGSRIVPENIEAIERFKAQGGLFTIASGRMCLNVTNVIREPDKLLNAPAIMANGTCLYDFFEGRFIDYTPLDEAIVTSALAFVRESFPTVGIRVSTLTGFVTDRLTGFIKKDLAPYPDSTRIINDGVWTPKDEAWLKVVFRDEAPVLEEVRAGLEKKFPGAFEYGKSSVRYLEIQMAGCNKAAMLGKLRGLAEEKLGTKVTVCACGDYENDLAMLGAADIAACPENAIDEVKKIADLCLCHCDEGFIAAVIDKLGENEYEKA